MAYERKLEIWRVATKKGVQVVSYHIIRMYNPQDNVLKRKSLNPPTSTLFVDQDESS